MCGKGGGYEINSNCRQPKENVNDDADEHEDVDEDEDESKNESEDAACN